MKFNELSLKDVKSHLRVEDNNDMYIIFTCSDTKTIN